MRFYIQLNEFQNVKDIFQRANVSLGANGADIWESYMMYVKKTQDPAAKTEYDKLLQDVALIPYDTFNPFKAKILEIIATTVSIKKARKIYNSFVSAHPKALEVHEMMSDLESRQVT